MFPTSFATDPIQQGETTKHYSVDIDFPNVKARTVNWFSPVARFGSNSLSRAIVILRFGHPVNRIRGERLHADDPKIPR